MDLGLSRKVAYTVAVLTLLVLAPACSKGRRTAAPPPPPPTPLQIADGYFESGDYPNAIKSFNHYLQGQAGAPDADRALFRLALAYGVADGATQDLPKGMQLLQQLVKQYPASPFKPPAILLLRLQDDVTRLKADMTKRDEKVKELAKELEKLKQIDMGRRPTRVPK